MYSVKSSDLRRKVISRVSSASSRLASRSVTRGRKMLHITIDKDDANGSRRYEHSLPRTAMPCSDTEVLKILIYDIAIGRID